MTREDPQLVNRPSRGGRASLGPGRRVLRGEDEDALRAGLEADGGQGSVEPELAVLRMIRHAGAETEPLSEAGLETTWSDISAQLAPPKRVHRGWFGLFAFAAAAATVALLLVPRERAPHSGPAQDGEFVADASSRALEAQFQLLEAPARLHIARDVEGLRRHDRGELLALVRRDADASAAGGAP